MDQEINFNQPLRQMKNVLSQSPNLYVPSGSDEHEMEVLKSPKIMNCQMFGFHF